MPFGPGADLTLAFFRISIISIFIGCAWLNSDAGGGGFGNISLSYRATFFGSLWVCLRYSSTYSLDFLRVPDRLSPNSLITTRKGFAVNISWTSVAAPSAFFLEHSALLRLFSFSRVTFRKSFRVFLSDSPATLNRFLRFLRSLLNVSISRCLWFVYRTLVTVSCLTVPTLTHSVPCLTESLAAHSAYECGHGVELSVFASNEHNVEWSVSVAIEVCPLCCFIAFWPFYAFYFLFSVYTYLLKIYYNVHFIHGLS